MQATTAQFAQQRPLVPDQGSESIEIAGAASSPQLGFDSVNSDDEFANGRGLVIAHGASPGRKIAPGCLRLNHYDPLEALRSTPSPK
jgi:hypothetical protein